MSEHTMDHIGNCHSGLGVTFPTHDGDGEYPVYVCHGTNGRPRFAIIVMDDTPIEEIVK